jgi:hypothetical protein
MSDSANLSALFADSGLGQEATAAIDNMTDALGPDIMEGLGAVTLDDITTSEVLLVQVLIDDSSSIAYTPGNSEAVRQGHNEMLAALKDSKSAATILVSCGYLNGGVLYPYLPLDHAPEMTSRNYNPSGSTPLYERTAAVLGSVIAKTAEFEQGGVAVRSVTFIITDGAATDYHFPVSDIKKIVGGMLRTEIHIVGGMGITDGTTDFTGVFTDMGIRPEWILTPANTPSEIRRAFGTISRSAVRASQAVGTFSTTALGGFGN